MTQQTRRSGIPEKGAFERHAQSLVAAVILAVLLYTGQSVQEIKEQSRANAIEMTNFQRAVADKVATLQSDITGVKNEIAKLSEERYRQGNIAEKLNDIENRLRNVEKEHAKIK